MPADQYTDRKSKHNDTGPWCAEFSYNKESNNQTGERRNNPSCLFQKNKITHFSFFDWDYWYKILPNSSELSTKCSLVNVTAHYQTPSPCCEHVRLPSSLSLICLGGLPGLARDTEQSSVYIDFSRKQMLSKVNLFKAFFHRPSTEPLLENITQFEMRLC